MRLFFAVTVPPEVVEAIAEVQREVRATVRDSGARWTRPEKFHYTLKFLGEQTFERAQTAVGVGEAIAQEGSRFSFTLSGIGAFPNLQRPATLWLGASQGADELCALAGRLDDVLSRRGFPREKKPAVPHLTLGRIKTYAAEQEAVKVLRTPPRAECGTFVVDRFVLMRSALTPGGFEYSVLREFELVGSTTEPAATGQLDDTTT
jgi:RNA 2',3'-cyclic 3'-phosphodiesterase